MNSQIRILIQKHILTIFLFVIGAFICTDLYFIYLQTHQELYLKLLGVATLSEAGLLGLFIGVQFWRTHGREVALKNSEQRLRLFTELMEECILLREGETILEVNDALAHMLGYEVSEMIGQNIFQFMDPRSVEVNEEWIKAGYPSNKNLLYAKCKDGVRIPLLIQGKDIEYQGRIVRLSCGWNVSDLMNLQESLRESEERLRKFAEATREGILVHDQGVVVDTNQALADMLGMKQTDFIGQTIYSLVDEASKSLIQKYWGGNQETKVYELSAKHADGHLVPIEVLALDALWRGKKMRMVKIWNLTERKKMEKALVVGEERLRVFAEATREGLLVHENGFVVDVNPALADMVGLKKMDFIGKDSLFFVEEKSKERVKKIRSGQIPPGPQELLIRHSDGHVIPVETLAMDTVWEGRKMRMVKFWNLTERKKNEKALIESQERFKRFAEVAKEGIEIHEDGRIVDANQTLAEMLGVKLEDLIGKDLRNFANEETKALMTRRKEEAYSIPYEITLRRADGSVFPVEIHGVNFNFQGKELRVVRLWDITERKKIEKALAESQERLKRFAEVTREGILIHDKGLIRDVNQALLDMVGYTAEELIGKMSDQFLDPLSLSTVKKFRADGYSTAPYEISVKTRSGAYIPVEVHSSKFMMEGKELRVVRLWDITERKKMEQELIESRERFERFSEVSKEGIVFHADGVVVDVNRAGVEMIGSSYEDLIGKKVTAFLDDDSARRAFKHLQEDSFSKAEEMNLVRSDKTLIPIEVTGAGLNVKGRNLRITNFWDLTVRKKIEEALRKSEESFRNLIEKSPDAILIHLPERTLYVNDAMLNMLGYSKPGELIGKVPTMIVHPDDVVSVRARIDRLKVAGDYNPPQEKRFIRKDRGVLYVDVVSFMIYFEGALVTVAVARDLTERKKVAEALRQSEKNFRNLIEKSPDGVIIHTLEITPKVVYVNDSLLRFLRYSTVEELKKLKPEQFIRSTDLPVIAERINKLKSHGDYNPPQEKVFIRKGGECVSAEVVSFFIHYEGVPMVAVIIRDLTERKKTEEALMKLERLSAIGEMSAGMAHEIRNPLAAISVAAQILQRKKLKEDSGQLETILQQADRLEKLIRDTLDFAKPDAPLNVHSVSIRSALESALRLSQVQFGPSHQKVRVLWDVPKMDIEVKAEMGRLQQILVNLILNAYQVLTEGGEIKLGFRQDNASIEIYVEDNGPGMNDEDMKRVFEPFFTTKKTGSGLGLAISLRIAQEYGGRIDVRRKLPRGTQFILRLPVSEE